MPKGDGDCDGTATFGGANGPIIRLNDARSRSTLIYALLHEYSHVLLVDRHPRDWGAIEHTDAFYRQLGVLERRWFDGGEVESTDF
jgi:Zn-dependent peptidase ImmA (M78 family)